MVQAGMKGFTMIEILIVVAILAAIGLFTVGVGNNAIVRVNATVERDTLVNVLTRARNLSMNNVQEVPHGVHLDANNFVIYENHGTGYDSSLSSNQSIPRTPTISISGFTDVEFEQLSGSVSGAPITIVVSDSGLVHQVDINSEGRINW